MRRLPGWRGRMAAFIDEVGATPFAWRTFDCGLAWSAEHVRLITGVDVAAPYRGASYADEAGAAALIAQAGFTDLRTLVSSLLPEIHISRARSGDLAGIPTPGLIGLGLGIVSGPSILTVGPRGYEASALLRGTVAWQVGEC